MKKYAIEKNGLQWELKDEETSKVLMRSSNKLAALRKAIALGLETGGKLNIYKKNGEWDESRDFDRLRKRKPAAPLHPHDSRSVD